MKLDTNFHPDRIAESSFIAPTATVFGNVDIGQQSSIWFGAVVRGDSERIQIGDRTNVQDQAVIHADPGFPAKIGNSVTIGHAAIIHGATIEDETLIGIRAVILNGAVVGKGSIVGAGAVVTEGTIIPPGKLAVGVPARVIRSTTAEDQQRIQHAADHYVAAIDSYKQQD